MTEQLSPGEQLSWLDIVIKPTEVMHAAPDNSAIINERMWDYFNGCIDLLEYDEGDRGKLLHVEVKTPMFERDDKMYPTNDRITYLFADHKLITLGIETRTVFNFIDAVFVSCLTNRNLFFLKNLYDIKKGKSRRERVYDEHPVFNQSTF